MSGQLEALLRHWRTALDARLQRLLPVSTLAGARRLNDAVHYAVFPGGRRWRPALTMLGAEAVGGRADCVLDVACGIEFVHTASLILDDLPAMDDALERRGRPTVYLVFGEGMALLAALALLNRGYGLFAAADEDGRLVREATDAIGADGMVGGQAVDIGARDASTLESRQRKTTTLVRLAVVAGGVAAGGGDRDVQVLARYGECLGAAYQICDDALDGMHLAAGTGKTPGQDARHGRSSWSACLGTSAARAAADAERQEAQEIVRRQFGDRPEARRLVEAAEAVLELVTGVPATKDVTG
jgi:geranylgeranyl pyrophosphate synthase